MYFEVPISGAEEPRTEVNVAVYVPSSREHGRFLGKALILCTQLVLTIRN